MSYTVKKLAEISGVSVRTLHFYDEIGLLKPTRGENNYRYYEEEQLLLLQQILFYRELGFELSEVQKIVHDKNFDKVTALKSHRKALEANVAQTQKLIQTINKTIAKIKGETQMSDEEIYFGFDKAKQEEYEKYIVNNYGDKLMNESKANTKNWKKEQFDQVKNDYDQIHKAITEAIKKNLKPESQEVQDIIETHFKIIQRFYTPTKEVYVGLGQLYVDHPDFRKLYDSYHPNLAKFMADSMKVFAEKVF